MNKSTLSKLAMAGIISGSLCIGACASHDSMSKSPASSSMGISSAKTMAAFNDACTQEGGMAAQHDCKGMNSCKGHSYQEGMAVVHHDCKGQSSCKGASCVDKG